MGQKLVSVQNGGPLMQMNVTVKLVLLGIWNGVLRQVVFKHNWS